MGMKFLLRKRSSRDLLYHIVLLVNSTVLQAKKICEEGGSHVKCSHHKKIRQDKIKNKIK